MAKKQTLQEFIDKAVKKFGNKFDYSSVEYINSNSHVTIKCPKHGDYQQTPDRHLQSRCGCPSCGVEEISNKKQSNLKDFIKKANKIHNNFYTYENTVYTSAKEKLTITCPIHGDFSQLASGHLSGYGCKLCADRGKGRVSDDKPCTLYYFNIVGTSLYKIGITSKTLNERYRTSFDRDQIRILFQLNFNTGKEAYEKEQYFLKTFGHLIYKGEKVLSTGNTEIFISDIFKGVYPENAYE
jgi:hypothetical protein